MPRTLAALKSQQPQEPLEQEPLAQEPPRLSLFSEVTLKPLLPLPPPHPHEEDWM
jgi:hypothetical protein